MFGLRLDDCWKGILLSTIDGRRMAAIRSARKGYTALVIDIIGAPFDLCGSRLGSRLGPDAIRLADLQLVLERLGVDITDLGDCPVPRPLPYDPEGLRNFPALLECIRGLRAMVSASISAQHIPLVLGGEHTLSVAGISAALQAFDGNLALLWIDAHADVNTPATSPSGNVHGMPIAALQGMVSGLTDHRDDDWRDLLTILGSTTLSPEATAWYGLRDVDPEERPRLSQGLAISMHEIDRCGIEHTVHKVDNWMRSLRIQNLWISFDVDALDPFLAPGTGTAVRGGLTYRESHLFAELMREAIDAQDCPYHLAGLDLVETNPLVDSGNETAKMAVEWVASLFGKTILGER